MEGKNSMNRDHCLDQALDSPCGVNFSLLLLDVVAAFAGKKAELNFETRVKSSEAAILDLIG